MMVACMIGLGVRAVREARCPPGGARPARAAVGPQVVPAGPAMPAWLTGRRAARHIGGVTGDERCAHGRAGPNGWYRGNSARRERNPASLAAARAADRRRPRWPRTGPLVHRGACGWR